MEPRPNEVKECCKRDENLQQEADPRPNVTVYRCQVCQCRHIEMTADPGVIGLEGAGI